MGSNARNQPYQTAELSVQRGFTLIELMVVITLVAILSLVAIGSYSNAIKRSQADSAVNQFSTHLSNARSEAIKNGKWVHLESKTGGWQNGWTITVDGAANAIVDQNALTQTLTIQTLDGVGTTAVALTKISFHPTGNALFLDGSDSAVDTEVNLLFSASDEQRNLHISPLGRVVITTP
jgi:prepilin-type N-terminal cleavage/methylation domain-containing protein